MSKHATALAITRLEVLPDRVRCLLTLAPGVAHTTNPALMQRVQEAFPQIDQHACVNNCGPVFGAVMNNTSLPHLLEHLVIHLQTQAAPPQSTTAYVGTTMWVNEREGRARIEVNFTDDLVALRAFRDALDFLNSIVVI